MLHLMSSEQVGIARSRVSVFRDLTPKKTRHRKCSVLSPEPVHQHLELHRSGYLVRLAQRPAHKTT